MTHPWLVAASSQTGSVHVRDGRPTQDAHRVSSDDAGAVIAVADGHGHPAYFRSDVGAALAVARATDVLTAALPSFGSAEEVEHQLVSECGPAVVEGWRHAVLDHARQHPFSVVEQGLVRSGSESDVLQCYGSTVIAMVATTDVLGVLQLGDGDAIVATSTGEVYRPLPTDPDLDGVRTTSLCQPDPLLSLRCRALDVDAAGIAVALVCTDGFGTSRVDPNWWVRVGRELVEHLHSQGFPWVEHKLPGWLEEPAQHGGDDTTLAVLARSDVPRS